MSTDHERNVNFLVVEIGGYRDTLNSEATRLRTPEILDAFDPNDQDAWCLAAMGDSLVRLRLFTEQNFQFVETIGIVAVSRYIFELSVWLKLFEQDRKYGLVYFSELMSTQLRYYRDYRKQLDREVALLNRFELLEKNLQAHRINELKQVSTNGQRRETHLASPTMLMEEIDAQAARHFSIYAAQAKTNGYGFQSHLIEKQVIPQVDQSIDELEREKAKFSENAHQEVKSLIPERWQWRQMAQKVDLVEEYDFIYTMSSKLLHATPASITTNQKNLELFEIEMFLRYIRVKLMDIIELARAYP